MQLVVVVELGRRTRPTARGVSAKFLASGILAQGRRRRTLAALQVVSRRRPRPMLVRRARRARRGVVPETRVRVRPAARPDDFQQRQQLPTSPPTPLQLASRRCRRTVPSAGSDDGGLGESELCVGTGRHGFSTLARQRGGKPPGLRTSSSRRHVSRRDDQIPHTPPASLSHSRRALLSSSR